MKNVYLIITFLLYSVTAYSQSFYVVTSNGVLQKVTLGSTGATSTIISNCNSTFAFGSIALYKNAFYQANGIQVQQGTVTSSGVVNCSAVSTPPLQLGNALTVDSTGVLYMDSGTDIYKVDPQNPVVIHVG